MKKRVCGLERVENVNKLFARRRTRVAVVLSALMLLGVVLSKPLIEFLKVGPPRQEQTAAAHHNADRIEIFSPPRLIQLMNPQAGSTVVDLGAGFGLFTTPLARAVGENGRVFATDTDVHALAYVEKRAKQENLRNVVTVPVTPKGLDPFYARHTFDLIFAADVLPAIEEPEAFFSRLRDSLREESGRLWVVDVRFDPNFTLWEFGDSKGLFGNLRSLGADSPVTRRLRAEVRNAVAVAPPTGESEGLATKAIEDLNRMLEDHTLWPEIRQGRSRLSPGGEKLQRHLLGVLERSGSFREGAGKSDEGQNTAPLRALRILNRLVLQDLLRSHRWEKAFSPTGLLSDYSANFRNLERRPDYIGLFNKAGFTFVREHRISPYLFIGEYKREKT